MNDHDLITTVRESFAEVQSETPVDQILTRSRIIRTRRRLVPGAIAVTTAAAAAIALTVSGSARPAPVAAQTTAYVVSHMTEALTAMAPRTVLFIHRTTIPARYQIERWSSADGQSRVEAFTPAGLPVWDSEISSHRIVIINYEKKTWSAAARYFPEAKSPAQWTCRNVESDVINGNPGEMASQLRTALSCGDLKVIGRGRVLRLSGDFNGGNGVTYWVNARTYLPFRLRRTLNRSTRFQENLRWLPPTASNLAKLRVAIPAGFTRVRG
jgi:hypothetical protein